MHGRELVQFQGALICQRARGPISLRLAGRDRAGEPVELLFSGMAASGPEDGHVEQPRPVAGGWPARLYDARVLELPAGGRWWIEGWLTPGQAGSARGEPLRREVQSRSLQVHRDLSARFEAAVPPVALPVARRWGWRVVLALLALPGAQRLLTRRRR